MKIRFARCRLDTDSRRLYRGTREVRLSPKAFELLRILAENRDRALSKSELLDRIWPGVYVSDMSLAQLVNEVRRAVGDRARDAQIVRTIHAYGYAFIAGIEDESHAAPTRATPRHCFWLTLSNRTFPLAEGRHIVGRDPSSAICLDSPNVSRRHASIVVAPLRVTIEDLGTKNGTWLAGSRVSAATELAAGDEIRIGPYRLTFRVSQTLSTTETEGRLRP
jgi:DNA-binding winged helix-turn-helix (wHTH) protein